MEALSYFLVLPWCPFIFFGFALVPFHIFWFCLGAPLTCLAALKKILRESAPKTKSCLSLKLATFEACSLSLILCVDYISYVQTVPNHQRLLIIYRDANPKISSQ